MLNSRSDIRIDVEELIIIESGTYNDQFLRPYVSQINGGLIDQLEQRYSKARRFTPQILANIANQFMVPDFHVRGVIEIPHGWSERRGRFILTLNLRLGTGETLKQVVLGYTNHVGFTTRAVDPDMEFYVNTTFMLTEQTVRTRNGRYERVWVPSSPADVLSDRENAGLRRDGPELLTMRPEDIYSAIDAEQTHELVDDVTDTRVTLSKNAIKSRTSNRLGSRYMARVLNGRQKALENSEYGTPLVEINASAQGYSVESFSSDDQFLRRISSMRGSNITLDNFTFRDLEEIDPTTDDRTDTMLLDNEAKAVTHYRGDTNEVNGQEEEDQIAALIKTAVPALMMECGLMHIRFQIHNQNGRHDFEFTPNGGACFVKNAEIESFVDKFEERLVDELMMPITIGSDVSIGIQLDCRIFGEVDFTLFYDGHNCGKYVFPCFSSMGSPIITDDRKDIRSLSKNFNSLFEEFLPDSTLGNNTSNGRDFGY